jgi:HK97 family phage major capsid protein
VDEKLKAALEAAHKAQAEYQAAAKDLKAEVEKAGKASAATQEKLDKIAADMTDKLEAAQKRWDELERKQNRERALGGVSQAESAALELERFNAMLQRDVAARRPNVRVQPLSAEHYAAYKKGFRAYLIGGEAALSSNPDFRAAMSVGSDPDGGYLVPADPTGRMVEFMRETSPMRQLANISSTLRDAKEGRYDLDEASTGWVGEKSTRSRTNTPALLGKYRIPIHEQYALLALTQNELDDADRTSRPGS